MFERGLRQHFLSPLRNRNDRSRGPDGTDYLNWMTPRDQLAIRKQSMRQKELTERLSPPKMHHKYQNFAVTDGFTASGFSAPQARNLSRFERRQIEYQDTERRLGVAKRRSEQIGALGAVGAQTLQNMKGSRKPFDVSFTFLCEREFLPPNFDNFHVLLSRSTPRTLLFQSRVPGGEG